MVLVTVFLPMSFLQGNVGTLFREFGFTIAAAVAFSSLVALTLTPMMTSKLFAAGAHRSRMADRGRTISSRGCPRGTTATCAVQCAGRGSSSAARLPPRRLAAVLLQDVAE